MSRFVRCEKCDGPISLERGVARCLQCEKRAAENQITVHCSECGAELRSNPEHLGKRTTCPKCKQQIEFVLPPPIAAPPPQPPGSEKNLSAAKSPETYRVKPLPPMVIEEGHSSSHWQADKTGPDGHHQADRGPEQPQAQPKKPLPLYLLDDEYVSISYDGNVEFRIKKPADISPVLDRLQLVRRAVHLKLSGIHASIENVREGFGNRYVTNPPLVRGGSKFGDMVRLLQISMAAMAHHNLSQATQPLHLQRRVFELIVQKIDEAILSIDYLKMRMRESGR